jgi:hypothetical protein
MNKILKANIHINWLFYRRSRLLLIIGILMLALFLLTLIPSLLFTSCNDRFSMALRIYGSVSGFTQMILIVIALISVWYHRANKCVKLIFTKNCTPELWIQSHIITAALIMLAGLICAAAAYVVLSLAWDLPLQIGIVAAVCNDFICGMLFYMYLILLTTWMHPIVALTVSFVLSERLFSWLSLLCAAGAERFTSGISHIMLWVLKNLFGAVYYILPGMSPLGYKLEKLSTSLRMEDGTWANIGWGAVYLIMFGSFCYLLTCYSLRRQRMN